MKSSPVCKTPPVLDVNPTPFNPAQKQNLTIKTISFTWGPTVPAPTTSPTRAQLLEKYKSELGELMNTSANMSKNLSERADGRLNDGTWINGWCGNL